MLPFNPVTQADLSTILKNFREFQLQQDVRLMNPLFIVIVHIFGGMSSLHGGPQHFRDTTWPGDPNAGDTAVDADYDNDSFVSLYEAWLFAKENDRFDGENPQHFDNSCRMAHNRTMDGPIPGGPQLLVIPWFCDPDPSHWGFYGPGCPHGAAMWRLGDKTSSHRLETDSIYARIINVGKSPSTSYGILSYMETPLSVSIFQMNGILLIQH